MENIILTNNKDLRLVSVKVGVLSTLRFELPLVSASATHVEVIVTSGDVHSAYTATFISDTKRWQCDIAASQFPAVGKQSYEIAYELDGKQFWDGKGWIEIEDATTSGIEPQPRPEPYRYAVVSVNGYGADAQGAVRIPKTFISANSPVTTEGYIEGDIYFNSETGATWTLCNVQSTLTWVFNYKNYYTKAETEEAIDRVAAYYITYDAAGNPFPTYAALANATTVYSGGSVRVPTRNDYCVVLADETHDNAEYRYIYAVAEGEATGSWQPQFPIETNDYGQLSNKPSINSVALAGNKTGAQLGLANATDLTPLQLAALYPEGDVKSASEWATPWNGSTGIKYELDATTHTAAILTFSKTSNTANDNSHLTGRVVIPPFIESNGERYTVASIKDHSTGALPTYDLTEVVAPTTLETIGRFAFYFCMGLKRAYFPRASQLKYNAFQDCRALEYISIPNVSNVPTQCFINDSSLKGLTIPNAESILLDGLSGCAALEVVNFGSVARSAVPTFYNHSFYNVPETCKIIIPDSQYDAWTTASGWSGLVTRGYQFLKHSEWEYARRYELAAKQDALSQTQLANIAAVSDALAFDATYLYAAGDPVVYNGTLYTFTAAHTGAWTGSDVSAVDIIARLAGKLDKSGGTMTGPLTEKHGLVLGKEYGNDFDGFRVDASGNAEMTSHAGGSAMIGAVISATQEMPNKANRAPNPTAGNLAALDANGNPTDAGWTAGDLARYSLVTKTISNGAVSLDDRASNSVTVSATLSPNTLTINFPTAPTGKLRDFAMRLNIAAGVTAPEIAWPQGVTLENNGGEVPEIADGGTGGSSTILYFSESENNGTTAKFTVKGETLTAIAQA